MAHYIIGDVHGCFDALQRLLEKISFNSAKDAICFVGDLVGRGPQPLEVVRFAVETPNVSYVLGNHDLWCMSIAYDCYQDPSSEFHHLFQTREQFALLDKWRKQSQLLIKNDCLNYIITHAGIPPQWSLGQAQSVAGEFELALHGADFKNILRHIEGDTPHCWQDDLTGVERFRYIVNAFARMRFCDANGCLDFKEKDVIESRHKHLKPWFDWPNQLGDYRLFYGHWAALGGDCAKPNIIATDTGCVYGGYLTAYKVVDSDSEPECFQVT